MLLDPVYILLNGETWSWTWSRMVLYEYTVYIHLGGGSYYMPGITGVPYGHLFRYPPYSDGSKFCDLLYSYGSKFYDFWYSYDFEIKCTGIVCVSFILFDIDIILNILLTKC